VEWPTVEEVVREYLSRHARPKKRSWREDARMLHRDVLPAWARRRARDVTARDVRQLLDAIVDRGAPIQANRTLAVVRRMFNWAAAPDRAMVPQGSNPCRGLERPAPERQRERVLSADELRALWQALDGETLEIASLFRLYMLTAQREAEVRTLRWADVDLAARWWTIPAARAKNGRAHRVPLSPEAVEILHTQLALRTASAWIFPSERTRGCRGRPYKAMHRLRRRSAISDFTPHDLRRTAASHMTSLGVPRLVVMKLLNHTERGVTAAYDRYGYDREKVEAVILWAQRLGEIVEGGRRVHTIGFKPWNRFD
jgi:integrase